MYHSGRKIKRCSVFSEYFVRSIKFKHDFLHFRPVLYECVIPGVNQIHTWLEFSKTGTSPVSLRVQNGFGTPWGYLPGVNMSTVVVVTVTVRQGVMYWGPVLTASSSSRRCARLSLLYRTGIVIWRSDTVCDVLGPCCSNSSSRRCARVHACMSSLCRSLHCDWCFAFASRSHSLQVTMTIFFRSQTTVCAVINWVTATPVRNINLTNIDLHASHIWHTWILNLDLGRKRLETVIWNRKVRHVVSCCGSSSLNVG